MGQCVTKSKNEKKLSYLQNGSEMKQFAHQEITKFYRFGKILGSGSFGTVRIAYNLNEEKNGIESKKYAVKTINKVFHLTLNYLKFNLK